MTTDFLKSYSRPRKQFIYVYGCHSLILEQNVCVIQSSKAGPQLHDIFSNDLGMILEQDEKIMFAGDTSLMIVHDDPDGLVLLVDDRLSLVLERCKFNKVLLDLNKSQFMIIGHKRI